MSNPICKLCNNNTLAITYRYKNKPYYEPMCIKCKNAIKENELKVQKYKKLTCDVCKLKLIDQKQLVVKYLDKNPQNAVWLNIKYICKNCEVIFNEK